MQKLLHSLSCAMSWTGLFEMYKCLIQIQISLLVSAEHAEGTAH